MQAGVGGLWQLLREDYETHGRALARPGFHALAVHRLGRWQQSLPLPWALPLRLLYDVLYFVVRNFYGIELPARAIIGRRLRISHHVGVIVNGYSVIGDDCVFRHNVTLGSPTRERADEAPRLGNGVRIGPGAVITGRITIGDNARIGPNAVVISDVPAGGRVVAPLADIRGPKPEARPVVDADGHDDEGRSGTVPSASTT